MKRKIFGGWFFLLTLTWVALPSTRAQAFDDLQKMCQTQAAVAMNVSRSRVAVRRGEDINDGNGNYILLWEARMNDGQLTQGYCQVDRRQKRIVRFENGAYRDHDRMDGDRMDGDRMDRGPVTDYPRVKVDTGGDGNFEGGRFHHIHVERVYLNTRDSRPVLTLAGHNFRIAFYGDVVRVTSPREFVLRIQSSDHGDVRGRAQIRLNPDRNEVEALDFHGRMDGDELNSTFIRGR